MIVGYARVSTEEQNLDLQIRALETVGCNAIYTDQGVSGALHERPGLERALAHVQPGGKLVVWKLDRLGRSLAHLVTLLDELGAKDVRFHSVTEHIDTSSSGGRLLFHMMAALAEFERSLISERTRAGMAAARSRGQSLGRPPLLTTAQVAAARHLVEQQKRPLDEVALLLGVHRRTVQRALAARGPTDG